MKKSIAALGMGLFLLLSGAWATQPRDDDPLYWLERASEAHDLLNFKGTFTYQAGERLETIRIFYQANGGRIRSKMKVLDGSPREIVRNGHEVLCFMPEAKTVVLSALHDTVAFPSRLLQVSDQLTENYDIKLGNPGRVAGYQARSIILTPKDRLRYGFVLWVELETGMLLRMQMTGEEGEVVERASFNEIHIGTEIDDESLDTQHKNVDDWRVINVKGQAVAKEQSGWALKNSVPGFAVRSVALKRDSQGGVEATHLLFNDGLAAVSVFVEQLDDPRALQEKTAAKVGGTTNIYRCVVDGHQLTAMGEVPMETVRRICTGMARKAHD